MTRRQARRRKTGQEEGSSKPDWPSASRTAAAQCESFQANPRCGKRGRAATRGGTAAIGPTMTGTSRKAPCARSASERSTARRMSSHASSSAATWLDRSTTTASASSRPDGWTRPSRSATSMCRSSSSRSRRSRPAETTHTRVGLATGYPSAARASSVAITEGSPSSLTQAGAPRSVFSSSRISIALESESLTSQEVES